MTSIYKLRDIGTEPIWAALFFRGRECPHSDRQEVRFTRPYRGQIRSRNELVFRIHSRTNADSIGLFRGENDPEPFVIITTDYLNVARGDCVTVPRGSIYISE